MTDLKELLKELLETVPMEDIQAIKEVRLRYPEVEQYKAMHIMESLKEMGVGMNHNTAETLRFVADLVELRLKSKEKMDEIVKKRMNTMIPNDTEGNEVH